MTPHAQDTAEWIEAIRSVCDPAVYLDVGAGDGFDCGVVKDAFPDCRCIAIEPVEAWEVDDRVEKQRDVIGRSDSWCVFHKKKQAGIHGIYSRIGLEDEDVFARRLRTLQHFCQRENVKKIDAMKIDVEGAAWDVLIGAGPLLDTVSAVHVETEWVTLFDGQPLESLVFDVLKGRGLTKIWENRVEELGQGDSIWVRR